jgi:lysophospholipase L1-like esterase
MRCLFLAVAACALSLGAAGAQQPPACDVPAYLVFADVPLKRVAQAVKKRQRLDILVVGTGSSSLTGPDGAAKAYPARLQAALQRRLPGVTVNVISQAKTRQTAADMVKTFEKLLLDGVPSLVVWQTGTVDAMRGVDAEEFRSEVDEGIEFLHARGADVVLMNMQYSPRTETMIQFDAYADRMRAVAREREVPLFDRLNLMRYWNDSSSFDLYSASKDNVLASKVHDCLGRALASLVIEAAHIEATESKPAQ